MADQNLTRRSFLKNTGLFAGSLVIGFNFFPTMGRAKEPAVSGKILAPNAFLKIGSDNQIVILLTHVEMGQGIWTTLPMLIAEELDANWSDIKVSHSPVGEQWNHTFWGIQITGGSSTTWSEFDRYRQTGAIARILLIEAAAKRTGVPKQSISTQNGFVIAGNKRFSYGELVQEAAALPAPENVVLRKPENWKYIGKGMPRLDAPVKVNGKAVFGMDLEAEGMLTAVVAHSPIMGGKYRTFDASKTLAYPGVRKVVEIPQGIAVLADHYWAAKKGKELLEVEWVEDKATSLDSERQLASYRVLSKTKGTTVSKNGDVDKGLSQASKSMEAEYVFPYLAHAPMEPLNCTVRLSEEKCEIWTGTQLPGIDRAAACEILHMKPEQVEVNTVFLGGGFGRRAATNSDFVREAVEIAKASGEYIKMVWSREDDIKGGNYRSSFVHRINVGLDQYGKATAWNHIIVGQSILMGTYMEGTIQNGVDSTSVEGVEGSPYLKDVPDRFIGIHNTIQPVSVLWYRSVGHTHTAYVMETMMDLLAAKQHQDPLIFRRNALKDFPRHLKVLNLAAEKADWSGKAAKGHYKGIAVHEAFGSFVCHVIEIRMTDGIPEVQKVTCAIDCGLAVNPDGVKAQMESGIIFGLTMALYGEIGFSNGRVLQSNFYDYKILRMHECPQIDVYIAPSTDKMGGAGECGVPQVAPALANAMFAATGKMVFQLPIIKNT